MSISPRIPSVIVSTINNFANDLKPFVFFLVQKTVTNRPLAGTIRRGKTLEEDYMLENQLLHDEKQCAEHIMLVDLGRNDVGKVNTPNFPLFLFVSIG